MTAWERLTQSEPELARIVGLAAEILRGEGDLRPEGHYRQLGMSASAASVAADPATVAAGVHGFGAWTDGAAIVPAVFVQPALAPRNGAPLSRTQARHLFPAAVRREVRGLHAVALSQPVPTASAAPGTRLTVGARHAMTGAAVRDPVDGQSGFLTAGHAAPNVGAIVRDSRGVAVGQVVRTLHPRSAPGDGAVADAAFVADAGRSAPSKRFPRGEMTALLTVELLGQRGPVRTWVRGLSPALALAPNLRPWAEVAITAEAISQAGDSGGPVLDLEGRLVGHAVGGTPVEYSLVQELNVQLSGLAVELP